MNKLSFISKNLIKKKYNPILNRNIIKNSLKNPLPGIDIGIPLNLFQNTLDKLYK